VRLKSNFKERGKGERENDDWRVLWGGLQGKMGELGYKQMRKGSERPSMNHRVIRPSNHVSKEIEISSKKT